MWERPRISRKRVAQYFVPPERLNIKTRLLVSKIADA